jgi:hypothetical protein
MTISTPYPGTEIWLTDARRFTTHDYRLFDVKQAGMPNERPLRKFYEEFVKTQDVLNRKHMGWQAVYDVFGITMRLLAKGQTNFLKMLWKFNQVYSVDRLVRDHEGIVHYPIGLPTAAHRTAGVRPSAAELYIHHPTAVAASA